jgi:hypothetical protein
MTLIYWRYVAELVKSGGRLDLYGSGTGERKLARRLALATPVCARLDRWSRLRHQRRLYIVMAINSNPQESPKKFSWGSLSKLFEVTIGGDDWEREKPLYSQNAREEALHERELGSEV